MGYTHYWYRTPALETREMIGRFAIDAMRLVQVATMHDIATEAEFTEGGFWVNGLGTEACESFWWPAVCDSEDLFEDGQSFNFCKTRVRPYDAVVTALILRAKVIYADAAMTFASDGTWDPRPYGEGNWVPGRNLYAATYGEQFPAHLEPVEIP